jgi:hypothetical protein
MFHLTQEEGECSFPFILRLSLGVSKGREGRALRIKGERKGRGKETSPPPCVDVFLSSFYQSPSICRNTEKCIEGSGRI